MTPSHLEALARQVLGLALVALRLLPCTVLLPYLSARALPAGARTAVLLVLALGLGPAALPAVDVRSLDGWLFVAAFRELTLGVALALVLAVPWFALDGAGRLLDGLRGGASAELTGLDQTRTTPLTELLRGTGVVVFLAAGGLRGVLRVLGSSLTAIPPELSPTPSWRLPALLELTARWTARALGASLTVTAAAWLSLVAMELVLAVSARFSSPLGQANLALPARALLPLAALVLTVGLWTGATLDLARETLEAVRAFGG
ncbi:MAG: flagellar biosynthetic protein FliR [Deltaproteobacteria bacterium]|nr:flagellar biosynthetic protein FliR [Deltaproteobacteria bacterium]